MGTRSQFSQHEVGTNLFRKKASYQRENILTINMLMNDIIRTAPATGVCEKLFKAVLVADLADILKDTELVVSDWIQR